MNDECMWKKLVVAYLKTLACYLRTEIEGYNEVLQSR
jgi:hypothetical protein